MPLVWSTEMFGGRGVAEMFGGSGSTRRHGDTEESPTTRHAGAAGHSARILAGLMERRRPQLQADCSFDRLADCGAAPLHTARSARRRGAPCVLRCTASPCRSVLSVSVLSVSALSVSVLSVSSNQCCTRRPALCPTLNCTSTVAVRPRSSRTSRRLYFENPESCASSTYRPGAMLVMK